MRVPTEYICRIARYLKIDPEIEHFEFEHPSGNLFCATRYRGTDEVSGEPFDTWEIEYNPGD